MVKVLGLSSGGRGSSSGAGEILFGYLTLRYGASVLRYLL